MHRGPSVLQAEEKRMCANCLLAACNINQTRHGLFQQAKFVPCIFLATFAHVKSRCYHCIPATEAPIKVVKCKPKNTLRNNNEKRMLIYVRILGIQYSFDLVPFFFQEPRQRSLTFGHIGCTMHVPAVNVSPFGRALWWRFWMGADYSGKKIRPHPQLLRG